MNPTTPDSAATPDETSQAQDARTRALHESEERLRLAMMVANDGFWDWKLTTNEVYFDPRYYLMADYEVDAFRHRLDEFQPRVHPDDQAEVMAVIQDLLNAQSARHEVEFRFRKKDGDYLWILSKWLVVERDEQGKPSRVVGTHSDITERKQAEEDLRKSEETFRLAMLASRDGLWDWTIHDNRVYYSPGWANILGETQVPAVFSTWEERIHPEDKPRTLATLKEHLEGEGDYWHEEHRLRMRDGNWKWVLGRGMVVARDTQGNPLRMVGTMGDISERKRAEEALVQSHQFYRQLLESTTDGVFVCGADSKFILWNSAMERISGVPQEKALGRHPLELFPFLKEQGIWELFERALAGESVASADYRYETPASDKSGWAVHEYYPLRDDHGNPVGVIGTVHDITERKQVEEKLRQQHTMLSRTEHIATLGSWEWDIEADHVRWSDELFRIFQRNPARGAPSFAEHPEIYKPEDMNRLRDAVETCLSKGTPYELELSHITTDGRIRQGIARGYPEHDSAGRIIRLVGSYQDITERKRAEAELQKKLAELQQWYEVTLGREGRVLELKREADALRRRLGEPPRYAVELADDLPAIPPAGGTQP